MVHRVISGKGYNRQLWFRYQHDGIADRKPNHRDTCNVNGQQYTIKRYINASFIHSFIHSRVDLFVKKYSDTVKYYILLQCVYICIYI